MGTVWYTSDLHLGHRFVAGLRGFDDPAEHDATIEGNFRALVRADDLVWWLGDLAVVSSRTRIEAVLARIAALPGRHRLIAGNHDPVHPLHRDAHKWQRLYLEVFESVQVFARQRISMPGPDGPAPVSVMLSHFPYRADHSDEPRYVEYRLPDVGGWLIHGHTHSKERRTSPREVHVGLDAWGLRPVSQAQLVQAMHGTQAGGEAAASGKQ